MPKDTFPFLIILLFLLAISEITIVKGEICERPSKTWFGKCVETQKCDKQCIEWEQAKHGACHQREAKYMCYCYFECESKGKKAPNPPSKGGQPAPPPPTDGQPAPPPPQEEQPTPTPPKGGQPAPPPSDGGQPTPPGSGQPTPSPPGGGQPAPPPPKGEQPTPPEGGQPGPSPPEGGQPTPPPPGGGGGGGGGFGGGGGGSGGGGGQPAPPPPEGGQPTPPGGGQPTPSPPGGGQPTPPGGGQPAPSPPGGQPTPPKGGQPAPPPPKGGHPPECKIPPRNKLAAEKLTYDINNNFNESIRLAKICEQPSKTWFGKCTDTVKCDKKCIEWEEARHGACHQRESKYMCFCYFSCHPTDKRPTVPPDCPVLPPK